MIIVLVGVHCRVMYTYVRQTADHVQGVYMKAFEQDFQIGVEEGAVPAFGDEILSFNGIGELGIVVLRAGFDTVDAFGTIQLPANVYQIRPVYFLDLHYRQSLFAEYIQHPPGIADAVPSGIVPVVLVHIDKIFLLDVNYQQGAAFF